MHMILIDTPCFTDVKEENERTIELIKGACIKHKKIHAIAIVADSYDENENPKIK